MSYVFYQTVTLTDDLSYLNATLFINFGPSFIWNWWRFQILCTD